MNKQIEEMAKAIEFCDRNLTANCHNVKCKECRYFYSKEDCYMLRLSEMLIAKGYRKSTDVAREIFEELEEFMVDTELYKMPTKSILAERFAELKKKHESEGIKDE